METQGHCYETAKAHYDKLRDSRGARLGCGYYQAMVETHLGALEEAEKEAPTAAEEKADPSFDPAGEEEAAEEEMGSSEEEGEAQEEPQAAAVAGGSLEALLKAAEGEAKAGKDAPAPQARARPSLLDAILANGGRAVKAEPKKAVKKAKYGKPGRPPVSKWRWLHPKYERFTKEDLLEVTTSAGLKQLIEECIIRPKKCAPCPKKTTIPYLRNVLLWARHKPEGYVSSEDEGEGEAV